MGEKASRLRAHERPRVNPYIKQYAARLATEPVCYLSNGAPLYLADPPEHGYVEGQPPATMSQTDGVPIVEGNPEQAK